LWSCSQRSIPSAAYYLSIVHHQRRAYPVCGAVDWVVATFKFRKKDQLELLATVDFASLELIQHKKVITMENVKEVIASSKKWTAKLTREIFSDENIRQALSELRQLFPKTYA